MPTTASSSSSETCVVDACRTTWLRFAHQPPPRAFDIAGEVKLVAHFADVVVVAVIGNDDLRRPLDARRDGCQASPQLVRSAAGADANCEGNRRHGARPKTFNSRSVVGFGV